MSNAPAIDPVLRACGRLEDRIAEVGDAIDDLAQAVAHPVIPATPDLLAEMRRAAATNVKAGTFVASTPLLESLRTSTDQG